MPAKRTRQTPATPPAKSGGVIEIEDDGFLDVTIKDADGGSHDVTLDVLELNNAFTAIAGEHDDESDRAAAWVTWLVEKKGLPKMSQGAAFKLLNVAITRAASFYAAVAPAPAAAPAAPATTAAAE